MSEQKRAVILVSGGLDSTTVLAMAQSQGYACYTLSFDYGQRHRAELYAAGRVSRALGDVEHKDPHRDECDEDVEPGHGAPTTSPSSITTPTSPPVPTRSIQT